MSKACPDCPECPLLDPEGPLSSKVPSSSFYAANLEVKHGLKHWNNSE